MEFHSSPIELEDTDELLETLEDDTELEDTLEEETLLEDATELEERLDEERAELEDTLELDFAEELLEVASGKPSQRTLSISREPVLPLVPETCQLKAFTLCRAEFTLMVVFVQSGWVIEVRVTVFLVQLFAASTLA